MEACLEVKFSGAKFRAEGPSVWVDEKYAAFLSLAKQSPVSPKGKPDQNGFEPEVDKQDIGPLALFLKTKNIGANQNKRFLATAVWLKAQGQSTILTGDVVKALAHAQQQRLGNPSDTLNQNVKKGFCVKNGDGFYVTPEGEESL